MSNIIAKSSQRKESLCATCKRSTKKGHISLGNGDWLECPDCEGTGKFVVYERRVQAPRHILVPGLKMTSSKLYLP